MELLLLLLALSLPSVPKVSCKMDNHSEMMVHHHEDGTATEEEVDDWYVTCTITIDDKKIYDAPLKIAHPTPIHDAIIAIDEFRKKQAAVIVKEYQSKHCKDAYWNPEYQVCQNVPYCPKSGCSPTPANGGTKEP